jgi:hypothetical protein
MLSEPHIPNRILTLPMKLHLAELIYVVGFPFLPKRSPGMKKHGNQMDREDANSLRLLKRTMASPPFPLSP